MAPRQGCCGGPSFRHSWKWPNEGFSETTVFNRAKTLRSSASIVFEGPDGSHAPEAPWTLSRGRRKPNAPGRGELQGRLRWVLGVASWESREWMGMSWTRVLMEKRIKGEKVRQREKQRTNNDKHTCFSCKKGARVDLPRLAFLFRAGKKKPMAPTNPICLVGPQTGQGGRYEIRRVPRPGRLRFVIKRSFTCDDQ